MANSCMPHPSSSPPPPCPKLRQVESNSQLNKTIAELSENLPVELLLWLSLDWDYWWCQLPVATFLVIYAPLAPSCSPLLPLPMCSSNFAQLNANADDAFPFTAPNCCSSKLKMAPTRRVRGRERERGRVWEW